MSAWPNDAAVQNHNGNGFPMSDPNAVAGGMMDPAAFMANPAQFNAAAANQFANPQQMMPMQNGPMRNASPSFQNPVYQTNQVIPSKRPRPREDSIASSPRQNPGMLPTSRADTPQQAQFANFQQQQGAIQQQNSGQHSPYPHLQPNGSANATPSPIMGNQMRPGSVPQRVSTTSPHPFSPAGPNFAPQASPIPSEHGGTPQPNPFMQQQNNFNPNFNQNFTPTPSPARPSPTPNAMGGQMMPQQMGQMPQQMGQMQAMGQMGQMGQMPNQMQQHMFPQQMQGQMPSQMQGQMQGQMPPGRTPLEQQKLMYQMQLQRQLQQGNMQMSPGQMQGQNMPQQRNMMPGQQMPNGQVPPGGMRPQQQQPVPQQQGGMQRAPNFEQFMKQLTVFMNTKQLPLETNPMIGDRPVNLMMLFQAASKFGGYRNICQGNAWPQVSNAVGFHPGQMQMAPGQLKGIYERNLLKFEEAWTRNKMSQQQQQQRWGQQQPPQQPGAPNAQGTPSKAMPQGQGPPNQAMQQPQAPQAQTPSKQPAQHAQQASVNGFATPQPPQGQQAQVAAQQGRNSISRNSQATPAQDEFALQSPAARGKAGSMSLPPGAHPDGEGMSADGSLMRFPAPFSSDPDEYIPCSREVTTYGGIDFHPIPKLATDMERWKPDVPSAIELGNIDIHALTMSLQSGIHGEVRLALDTLATVTASAQQNLEIDLTKCDDLLESLIECAEDQVEALAENTTEVSDEILITSYEDLVRNCRLESFGLRDIPVFGSPDYELDRAVDRLICITTILRNLSFGAANHGCLADETVVKFLGVVIRYLGTRTMLLRTQANTLDFMKDMIIFLSNIAHSIELPGREQALCLLQFLLAFAPTPVPTLTDDEIFFTPYDSSLHPYLPAAVDALAKLLARDEPNRTHYKAIFEQDAVSSPPCELLTRTFALAISPLPDQSKDHRGPSLPPVVEMRKPSLMQGLLAGDIIASLAPGYESGVTRAWLSSGNSFAQNLFRLIRVLSMHFETPPPARGSRAQPRKDGELVYIVVLGVSMLRRLSEKAKDPSDPKTSIPPNLLPSSDTVLGALQMNSMEWTKEGFLQQLIAYAALDDRGRDF